MCVTRKHYEYEPVWPSDYAEPTVDDVLVEVLHSEDDDYLDTMECRCGTVSSATWDECNDRAFICPNDQRG